MGAGGTLRTAQDPRPTAAPVLYIATLASARCNPARRPFYQRLRATGKPAKVALVAAIRKLLRILNAMLKTKAAWSSPRPSPSRVESLTGGILKKFQRRPTLRATLPLDFQCGRFLPNIVYESA
jgi:hypothetical protein